MRSDFTIYLSQEEISGMLSDVEETLVFTGSKPVAAVWLTVAGVMGGVFGGVVVSGAMWRSVWLVLAYLLILPLAWLGMRRLTFGICTMTPVRGRPSIISIAPFVFTA